MYDLFETGSEQGAFDVLVDVLEEFFIKISHNTKLAIEEDENSAFPVI